MRHLETAAVLTRLRVATAALTFVLALACPGVAAPAAAAESLQLHNESIFIQYIPPKSDKFQRLYEKLKARQLLEELDAFLSPLDFGENGLTLSVEEGDELCKNPNSYYDGRGVIHLCYSWFYFLENEVAREYPRLPNEPFLLTTPGLVPGFTRADVVLGGTVSLVLHELGHAVFDLLNIPRFGREEEAADQFAGFFMLQFGPSVALTTVKGAYNAWHHSNARRMIASKGALQAYVEGDSHSLDIQRAYDYLCLAYGKDRETFKDLAENLLPRVRREQCDDEYAQVALAFKKTLLPKINVDLMKKVQEMQIFRPEDFKF